MPEKLYTQADVDALLDLLGERYLRVQKDVDNPTTEWMKADIKGAAFNQWALAKEWAETHGHVPDDENPAPDGKTPPAPNDTGESGHSDQMFDEMQQEIMYLKNKVKALEADNNRWKTHAAEREGQAATLNARLEDMTDLCETMRAEIIDLRERTFSRKEMKGALKLLAVQWFEKMARINVRDSEIPF